MSVLLLLLLVGCVGGVWGNGVVVHLPPQPGECSFATGVCDYATATSTGKEGWRRVRWNDTVSLTERSRHNYDYAQHRDTRLSGIIGHPPTTGDGYIMLVDANRNEDGRVNYRYGRNMLYRYSSPTRANLTSPALTVEKSHCLVFNHINKGGQLNTVLEVHTQGLSAGTSNLFKSEVRDQVLAKEGAVSDRDWRTAKVNLPIGGPYKIVWSIVKPVRASAAVGAVVAVDDIAIYEGSCTEAAVDAGGADCSFESDSFCHYSSSTSGPVEWKVKGREELPPGLIVGAPRGRFLAITATDVVNVGGVESVTIKSPVVDIDNNSCLVFNFHNDFHMYNEMNGNASFNIIVSYADEHHESENITLRKRYSRAWQMAYMDVEPGNVEVYFEALVSRQRSGNAYMAIDNIEIVQTICDNIMHLLPVCERGEMLCGTGTCYNVGFKSFRCACPPGFYGARCEHKPPCEEKRRCLFGTCMNKGKRAYACECRKGYQGVLCDSQTTCGAPPEIDHGSVVNVTNLFLGGTVKYKCHENYTMIGNNAMVCDGSWAAADLPKCQVIDCGLPPQVDNGVIDFTFTSVGAIAPIRCNDGYHISGYSALRCSARKVWVPVGKDQSKAFDRKMVCTWTPTCEDPPTIRNGQVDTVEGKNVGGKATYSCFPGYHIRSQAIATCTLGQNGTALWAFLPECVSSCSPVTSKIINTKAWEGKWALLEITDCETSESNSFIAGKTCRPPFSLFIPAGPIEHADDVIYDGEELCIAVKRIEVQYVESQKNEESNNVTCVTFCLRRQKPVVEVRTAVSLYHETSQKVHVKVETKRFFWKDDGQFSLHQITQPTTSSWETSETTFTEKDVSWTAEP